jgi:hypothetical protein
MAMLEVNDQFADSVAVSVASEELEPALGWPYDALAKRWSEKPAATPAQVATILTEEYQKLYLPGGQAYGDGEVTLSSADLTQAPALNRALRALGEQVRGLDRDGLSQIREVSEAALRFDTSDYVDLGDFLKLVAQRNVVGLSRDTVATVRRELDAYVISNHTTPKYKRATGISFWLPTNSWTFDRYRAKYETLTFDVATAWSKTIEVLLAQ